MPRETCKHEESVALKNSLCSVILFYCGNLRVFSLHEYLKNFWVIKDSSTVYFGFLDGDFELNWKYLFWDCETVQRKKKSSFIVEAPDEHHWLDVATEGMESFAATSC